ncbi:MAG TPA: sporulation membrane protein YtaF [Clostridiales bacterium]|nr:sporulation membrane protein YtaF [Clostridiales bacterium]
MLFNILILAFSSSIDSFGIGITYGLRKIKLSCLSSITLFIISIIITCSSILIGKNLNYILPEFVTSLIGSLLLILMGSLIIFQVINKKTDKPISKSKNSSSFAYSESQKIYQFFIKFLGITIQIIKDPISSDLDNSKKIDIKESIYLGVTLSIDSFCIGIGSSILGISSVLFPILVSVFQIIFLSLGRLFAIKVDQNTKIPDNTWNLVSGILLIFIGISKLFI